jgi:hypothetical protein
METGKMQIEQQEKNGDNFKLNMVGMFQDLKC